LNVTEASPTGINVSIAVFVVPPTLAVMVAEVGDVTVDEVIVKLALDCQKGIVTEFGTDALELLLWSRTIKPLGPTGPVVVTVPVEEVPPATLDGFNEIDRRSGGLIVRVA